MSERRTYLRFPLSYRVEHWVLMLSFTTLALTGLVQKYAQASVSVWIVGLFGGVEIVRVTHHAAAVILMLEVVYHIGAVGYRLFVHRAPLSMLPSLTDVRLAVQAVLYNLGLRSEKPQQGRYTFEEKAEYWAVVWGTLVMAVTGFMMWNPIATTRLLPGEFVPAAKAAHGGEALLAVLAIIVWHMYHVHIRRFNKSIFTGRLTEQEMLEEHPLELADLKAGMAARPVDPTEAARRRRIFVSAYLFLAGAMLAGIYLFVTFEHTAITTLPPAEQVVVYAPLTPTPLPTPLLTTTPSERALTSWSDGIADLFQERCGACHWGASGLGGLDLSRYASALQGGNSGAAVVPGDVDSSVLVVRQALGNHPGQLSGTELAQVRAWIEYGAPEE